MQTEGVFLITYGCDPDHILADRSCLKVDRPVLEKTGKTTQLSEFIIFVSLPPLLQPLNREEQRKHEASDDALRPFLRAVRV